MEAEERKQVATKAVERQRNKAAKAEGDEAQAAFDEVIGAAQIADGIEVPPIPRLLADDATPEAAASLLAEQGGTLAIISAEGGIFDIIAGRYSPKAAPNMDLWLKGHSGDPLRVDRKGRPPEHIPRPALTLGLMIQPTVLGAIAANHQFRGRGFLARIPAKMADALQEVHSVGGGRVGAHIGEGADRAGLEVVADPGGRHDCVGADRFPRAFVGAALGQVQHASDAGHRLCPPGVEGGPPQDPVPAGRPRGRADLRGRAEGTRAGFAWMGRRPGCADPHRGRTAGESTASRQRWSPPSPATASWPRWRTGARKVSERDVFTAASRGRFKTTEDLRPALHRLVDHGYLMPLPEPRPVGAGRPAPRYRIHKMIAETAQTAERHS